MSAIRLDWVSTHDAVSLARNMFMHYHALLVVFIISCVLSSTMILCLSSLSLSFSLLVMALKKSIPSKNPILRGSSSSSSTPSNSIQFCDEKACDDFFENFSNQVIHLECQVILSNFPDTPLPDAFSSQGWASLCEKPSRCPDVFIQEFYSNMHAIDIFVPRFSMVFLGTRIIVTLELISEVLRVPRVNRSDYLSHHHLSSIFRDELALLFYEKAMLWGGTLNFSTTEFVKGPQILNMVMTFVLTPRSHYNTITLPRAYFLLSLM